MGGAEGRGEGGQNRSQFRRRRGAVYHPALPGAPALRLLAGGAGKGWTPSCHRETRPSLTWVRCFCRAAAHLGLSTRSFVPGCDAVDTLLLFNPHSTTQGRE